VTGGGVLDWFEWGECILEGDWVWLGLRSDEDVGGNAMSSSIDR